MDRPQVFVPPEVQAGDGPALGAVVLALEGTTMGTVWRLRLAGPRGADLDGVRAAVQDELDLVIAQMSHWAPDSDLSRFNRAPAGTVQVLPDAFAEVLACALDVARASGGAFDPAAGALVRDWGFGATRRHDEPGFAMPAGPLPVGAVPGWQTLDFDPQARTLRQPGGVQLDFSGIAKGHAVDRVAQRLRRLGWRDGLVEIGGELSGWGVRPDGLPWWVDLSRPDGHPPTARVALHHVAVATSGDDVRRFRDGQGRWRSHTIDPRRGEPVAHGVASVSVLHLSAMVADAWATALTVLGADDGLALADRLGLAVYLVERGPGNGEGGEGGQIERISAALRRWAA